MASREHALAGLFRWALRLYPAAFRDEYGRELRLVFVDRLRAQSGSLGRLAVCLAAIGGVLRHAPEEHARLFAEDLRYARRLLWRDAWVTIVSVATIGLGIGTTCAVFSVSKSLLLDALPYANADRIVTVWVSNPRQGFDRDFTSYPRLLDWREQSRLVEAFAAFTLRRFELTGNGEPESLNAASVTGNFFHVMGTRAAVGRQLRPEDEPNPTCVISHGLWQRRFAGLPTVLGDRVVLDGIPHTVVGVLPADFHFPDRETDAWISLQPGPDERAQRSGFWLGSVARLRPGTTVAQAQIEMDAVARRLARTHAADRDLGVTLVGLQDDLTAPLRPALLTLTAASIGVLLIACSNVAALLIGRGRVRRREVAIRAALGAGRWRVVRQLVTEAVVLFAAGGIVGLLLGWLGLRWLVATAPPHLAQLADVTLDGAMVAFTLALALATGVVFGLFPSWVATRPGVAEALTGGDKGGGRGALSQRLRGAIVVGQVAITTLVLSVSVLLVGSVVRLQRVDPGFAPRGVLTVRLTLPESRYAQPPGRRVRFFEDLLVRLRAVPGVVSAGGGSSVLIGPLPSSNTLAIEGVNEDLPLITTDVVTPDFLESLRVPVIKGRRLTAADREGGLPVALINETAARRYWKGRDPVGSRFQLGGRDSDAPWLTVVGVVADTRRAGAEREPYAESYRPLAQVPGQPSMTLVVRTAGDHAAMAGAVRSAVAELDRSLPLVEVATLDALLDRRTVARRFNAWLLSAFSTTAMALTAVGLYGVLAYLVILRRREFAVRLALGASPREIVELVVFQGFRLTAVGAVLGTLAAWLAARWVQHLLPDVGPGSPTTALIVASLVAAATLGASYVPARRAIRVDPVTALRAE